MLNWSPEPRAASLVLFRPVWVRLTATGVRLIRSTPPQPRTTVSCTTSRPPGSSSPRRPSDSSPPTAWRSTTGVTRSWTHWPPARSGSWSAGWPGSPSSEPRYRTELHNCIQHGTAQCSLVLVSWFFADRWPPFFF